MPQVEYGHLHKFVVSIGLVLIGSAGAVNWAVLREASVLTIPRKDLRELTPIARETIMQQQGQLATVTDWYQFFCAMLVLCGVACVGYGLWKWRPQQRQADDLTAAEARKRVEDLERASDEARVEKLAAEADEIASPTTGLLRTQDAESTSPPDPATSAERSSEAFKSRNDPADPVTTDGVAPGDLEREARRRREVLLAEYQDVEARLSGVLSRALQPFYLVRSDVLVATEGRGRSEVADFVAVSTKEQYPDLVFEYKYAPNVKNLRNRARDATDRAARLAERLERSQPGREVTPIAIVVCPDAVSHEALADVESLSRGRSSVTTIVMTQSQVSEFESDPEIFWIRLRRRIESGRVR